MNRLLLLTLLATPALAARGRVPAEPVGPPQPPVIQEANWAPNPGSTLSVAAARRMVGQDGYSRQPGDIITVMVVEQTVTNMDADTQTKNASSNSGSIGALFGISNPVPLGGGSGDLGFSTNRESDFRGSGKTGRGSSLESVVSCTITDVVQPIMDYNIWCTKQVTVNKETQWVVLKGRVRARDIRQDNTVLSDRIAHAQIEVTGRGVVADKQRPGLLVRVLDALWPF